MIPNRFSTHRFFFFILLAACAWSGLEAQVTTCRAYFIGNSVTDCLNYRGLAALVQSRGKTYVWAREMIPGSPLFGLWKNYNGPNGVVEQPYGFPQDAFTNYSWDAMTLQPFDRHIVEKDPPSDGDSVNCANFANLLKAHNPNAQAYIYQRWPRQSGTLTADNWNALWLLKYTGGWDNSMEARDMFEKLTWSMRKSNPMQKKFMMVPIGEVFYQLNKKMAAGQVPGYTSIWGVYADGIHMGGTGSFICTTTMYATLFKESPVGAAVPSDFGSIDVSVVRTIQQTVWDVVTTYKDSVGAPWSGVTAGTGIAVGSGTGRCRTVSGDPTYFSLRGERIGARAADRTRRTGSGDRTAVLYVRKAADGMTMIQGQ